MLASFAAPEALEKLRLARELSRQELDRHRSIEGDLSGAIDLAHPPLADLLDQLEVTQAPVGLLVGVELASLCVCHHLA